ncbi:unnamed protein product [Strongylus vulgaris]|uniref:Glucuronosyltransferase n=1 Tax=Strongylus vulgaris TaxID=40348 RepID=A0A3P7L276_STRVU|nr:unnamed protein product [Strongylus vulgaris]
MHLTYMVINTLISLTSSYKYLVYSPFLGHSHVNFLGSLADVLTEGGHDVTVLMPETDIDEVNRTGVEITKRIIRSPGDPRATKVTNYCFTLVSAHY